MAIIPNLLLLTILIVGGVTLQIFLSLRPAKWPGLVLPGICFLLSLIQILSYTLYSGATALTVIIALLWICFIANIPTLILLAIYFACRQKYRKKEEINRMNIQDLE